MIINKKSNRMFVYLYVAYVLTNRWTDMVLPYSEAFLGPGKFKKHFGIRYFKSPLNGVFHIREASHRSWDGLRLSLKSLDVSSTAVHYYCVVFFQYSMLRFL